MNRIVRKVRGRVRPFPTRTRSLRLPDDAAIAEDLLRALLNTADVIGSNRQRVSLLVSADPDQFDRLCTFGADTAEQEEDHPGEDADPGEDNGDAEPDADDEHDYRDAPFPHQGIYRPACGLPVAPPNKVLFTNDPAGQLLARDPQGQLGIWRPVT